MSRVQTSSPALLKKSTGAGKVGTSSGSTVQAELNGKIRVVANVSALKAGVPLYAGERIYLAGYSVEGVGGGFLTHLAGDTTTLGNDVSVFVAASNDRWKRASGDFITAMLAGALADGSTDDSAAIQRAVNAGVALDQDILFPTGSSGNGYKVNSAISISRFVKLKGQLGSRIFTSNDIGIFDFTSGNSSCSYSIIEDLTLVGSGVANTQTGVQFVNSNNVKLIRTNITGFRRGVQFAPGVIAPFSCYCCSIEDSVITGNNLINIEGLDNTNVLTLRGTTFGSSATGLRVVSSNNLSVFGGDAEACTLCAVDLDTSSSGQAGHTLIGVHFENNTSSAGDIRIGATNAVNGVSIRDCLFKGGAGADSAVNAIRGSALLISGGIYHSGYTQFARIDPAYGKYCINSVSGVADENQINWKPNERTRTYSAPIVYDTSYADTASYNLYNILSTNISSSKNYYAGIDVIRIDSGAAPGVNAKAYARAFIASNGYGALQKCGAWYAEGDCDIEAGALSVSESAGAPAITNGATITASATGTSRVSPASAVTGIILEAGKKGGQILVVVNESAFSITFAAAGTSRVADGASSVITLQRSAVFVWDSSTSLWYRS